MKFHRISLRDFRAIRRLTIEPAEHGVTIVQGDNEVGKSSIAEALWLIFEQHDDSASQVVRSIRPVDRDAASEIEVDVSSGPYRFTYFKRFHRGARTELRIKEPRAEILTGREADNRAKAILNETIDVALWKALRFQQGVSDDLEQLPAAKHQSLLTALDAASDLLGGDREKSLFERVQAEYDRYFTGSGREKAAGPGANAPRLRAARDQAATEVDRLMERIITLERRAIRASVLDSEIAAVDARRETLAERVSTLTAADEQRRQQHTVVDALASDVRACEATWREAQAAQQARAKDASSLADRREELARLRDTLETLEGPATDANAGLEAAQAALDAAQAVQAERRAEAAAAEESVHLASAAFTAQTMAERLERLEANEPEAARLRAWLADCRLDARALTAINRAEDRVKGLQVRRESEGAAVEIAAENGLEFEVNGKPVRIEPGRVSRGTISGESRITLPGGVTITIRAGTAAREIEAQARQARAQLDELLAAAGVDSVHAAEDLVRERAANEARLHGLEDQVRADLRDLGSVDELRAKLERERERIARARDATAPVPSLEAAKAAREEAVAALASAESAVDDATRALDVARAAAAGHDRERQRLTDAITRLNEECAALAAALEAARAEVPDEALAARVAEAEPAATSAASRLDEARAALESLADVSDELSRCTEEAASLEGQWIALTKERAEIRGVLEDAGADGLHGRLTEAEQHLDAAEEDLDAFVRRAEAARVLFEAMKRHRDAARENYAGPLRQKIEALGKLAYGPGFGVELSDDLQVVRRTQDGVSLDVSQLSTGAREQLSVLTRLACASLVSENGGAPLVLDDIFGWADPKRLRALGPILAQAAAETQVFVFTCTPGRFDSVAPARVVSLPSGQWENRVALDSPGSTAPAVSERQPAAPARRAGPIPAEPQATLDLFPESEPAATR